MGTNFGAGVRISEDFITQVYFGEVDRHSIVNVDGALLTGSASATVPIADAGVYQQPTAAASLEVVSASANDTAAGSGARTVKVTGLDANWAVQTETVSMNGVTAVALTNTFLRVYGLEVVTCGTFSSYDARNNYGAITLRVASAGATWAQILGESATRGYGRSHIGGYTIPTGYRGYVLPHTASISAGGSTGLLVNTGPSTTSAPFTPMNMYQLDRSHATGHFVCEQILGPFTGPTDLCWIAINTTGTGPCSMSARILLEQL